MAAPDIQTALQAALATQAQDDRNHENEIREAADRIAKYKEDMAKYEGNLDKYKSGMLSNTFGLFMAWKNPQQAIQSLGGLFMNGAHYLLTEMQGAPDSRRKDSNAGYTV